MARRHDTQLFNVRRHLLLGNEITPIDALNKFGCFRLSALIYIIRNEDDIPVASDQPEASNGKPYSRYWIPKDQLPKYHQMMMNHERDW